jgi:hypothetical protein
MGPPPEVDFDDEEESRQAVEWFQQLGLTDSAFSPHGDGRITDYEERIVEAGVGKPWGSAWTFENTLPLEEAIGRSTTQIYHFKEGLPVPRNAVGILPEHILSFPPRDPIRTDYSAITTLPLVPLHSITRQEARIGYFEATLCSTSPATSIAVGLACQPYPPFRLPGKHHYSIAAFSDGRSGKGKLIVSGRPKWEKWRTSGQLSGATVGVGFAMNEANAIVSFFFTRDGSLVAADGFGKVFFIEEALIPLADDEKQLLNKVYHACIGADGEAEIAVNFGEKKFLWVGAEALDSMR